MLYYDSKNVGFIVKKEKDKRYIKRIGKVKIKYLKQESKGKISIKQNN